jgi:hypothetical protein
VAVGDAPHIWVKSLFFFLIIITDSVNSSDWEENREAKQTKSLSLPAIFNFFSCFVGIY